MSVRNNIVLLLVVFFFIGCSYPRYPKLTDPQVIWEEERFRPEVNDEVRKLQKLMNEIVDEMIENENNTNDIVKREARWDAFNGTVGILGPGSASLENIELLEDYPEEIPIWSGIIVGLSVGIKEVIYKYDLKLTDLEEDHEKLSNELSKALALFLLYRPDLLIEADENKFRIAKTKLMKLNNEVTMFIHNF
jgi:hypothetical protein